MTELYNNRIYLFFTACLLWLTTGCDFKNDLCYLDHPHSERLTIEPDWGQTGQTGIPARLRMLVYRTGNENLWLDTVVETDEKIMLGLPQDYYMMLLFNEDFNPMMLNQSDDYFNAHLQLPELITESTKTSSASAPFTSLYRSMRQPGRLFTGSTQLDFRKILPEKVTVPIQERTKTLVVNLNLNGSYSSIEHCEGMLSGLASAIRLYRGEAIKGNPGVVEFPFTRNETDHQFSGSLTFLDADTEDSRYSNKLQMTFDLKNGRTLTRTADITQWLSEQINEGKNQLILTLNVSLESDQTGGIIIDDSWGDDIIVPIY